MKHTGNLTIATAADAEKHAAVTEVTGYLAICATASLPALKSIGGTLYINANASLPVVTSVGGYLNIHADASLPALTGVGDDLVIYAKLSAPLLYPKGFDSFRVYDGIPCAIISAKEKDGVELLNCRHARIKDGKIAGDRFIVAKRGDTTAHANTIKEALEELAFKLGARDVEQYRNMPLTTRKSPKQWATIYRQVTGACQFGTQDFMARRTLKKSYTLAEILEETKGAFGHDTFREVVTP